eukprot:TRINITY_DN5924_c0_g1_i1.p1 TRINITY_DN5924_c0_g1~~TRINITY_DN5924_c0_g1_i1.p1  ORF type:complete len:431 (+),score=24.93 TRINITY_DN5924_c0_g1_i1:123-1295(+)
MDGTNGAAFFWSCASSCPGGAWADKDCTCACVPDPHARPTTTSTKPAETTQAAPTDPSDNFVAPVLPLPSTSFRSQSSDPVAHVVKPRGGLPWWLILIAVILSLLSALLLAWLCISFAYMLSDLRDPDRPRHHKRAQVAPAPEGDAHGGYASKAAIVVTDIESGNVTTIASSAQVHLTTPDRSPLRSPAMSRATSRGSSASRSSSRTGSGNGQLPTCDKKLNVSSTLQARTLSPSCSPRTLISRELDAGAAQASRGRRLSAPAVLDAHAVSSQLSKKTSPSVPGSEKTSPSRTPERQRSPNRSNTRSPSPSVLNAQVRSSYPSSMNRLSVPGSEKRSASLTPKRERSPASSHTRSPSPNVTRASTPSCWSAGSSSRSPSLGSASSRRSSR